MKDRFRGLWFNQIAAGVDSDGIRLDVYDPDKVWIGDNYDPYKVRIGDNYNYDKGHVQSMEEGCPPYLKGHVQGGPPAPSPYQK